MAKAAYYEWRKAVRSERYAVQEKNTSGKWIRIFRTSDLEQAIAMYSNSGLTLRIWDCAENKEVLAN